MYYYKTIHFPFSKKIKVGALYNNYTLYKVLKLIKQLEQQYAEMFY